MSTLMLEEHVAGFDDADADDSRFSID